jgi:hypothetical protein
MVTIVIEHLLSLSSCNLYHFILIDDFKLLKSGQRCESVKSCIFQEKGLYFRLDFLGKGLMRLAIRLLIFSMEIKDLKTHVSHPPRSLDSEKLHLKDEGAVGRDAPLTALAVAQVE